MPHYYAVIDFECTCWESEGPNTTLVFPHEIIEFPVIFLNSETLQIDYEFHSYVKPIEQLVLSPFCVQLTGIKQNLIDDAPDLCNVIAAFDTFLTDNEIHDFTACTNGPWDFHKFLYQETERKKFPFPQWAKRWIDIRRRFQGVYNLENWVGVTEMLGILGLEFEGRPHSGIDDARNIARIVAAVHQKSRRSGKPLKPNRFIKNRK